MKNTASVSDKIRESLNSKSDPKKVEIFQRFFKTGEGQYGEGDVFIGVNVPQQRATAKEFYSEATLKDIENLLADSVHEFRLTALFILVLKFSKCKSEKDREEIFNFYISNLNGINNWDLVDSSADKIVGAYLFNKEKTMLYDLADSNHLWKQRIAVISTFYFIRKNQFAETISLCEKLLNHKHDLLHKACGWMLREVGKRDLNLLLNFLEMHASSMPRTMLRYSIEKLDQDLRQKFLSAK
jgi:3-methyladenine DNA glycosylase AlkD